MADGGKDDLEGTVGGDYKVGSYSAPHRWLWGGAEIFTTVPEIDHGLQAYKSICGPVAGQVYHDAEGGSCASGQFVDVHEGYVSSIL